MKSGPPHLILPLAGMLVSVLVVCVGGDRVLPPPVAIVARHTWDRSAVACSRPQRVRRIVVHHDAVDHPPERTGEDKLRALLDSSRNVQGWEDLPYHYLIDRDGRVFAGLPEHCTAETHTRYDPSDSLHIALLGNYNALQPTPAQLEALRRLVFACAVHFGLPVDSIRLHGDLTASDCPGDNLRRRLARVDWFDP